MKKAAISLLLSAVLSTGYAQAPDSGDTTTEPGPTDIATTIDIMLPSPSILLPASIHIDYGSQATETIYGPVFNSVAGMLNQYPSILHEIEDFSDPDPSAHEPLRLLVIKRSDLEDNRA